MRQEWPHRLIPTHTRRKWPHHLIPKHKHRFYICGMLKVSGFLLWLNCSLTVITWHEILHVWWKIRVFGPQTIIWHICNLPKALTVPNFSNIQIMINDRAVYKDETKHQTLRFTPICPQTLLVWLPVNSASFVTSRPQSTVPRLVCTCKIHWGCISLRPFPYARQMVRVTVLALYYLSLVGCPMHKHIMPAVINLNLLRTTGCVKLSSRNPEQLCSQRKIAPVEYLLLVVVPH
jgi:hypothetical protein